MVVANFDGEGVVPKKKKKKKIFSGKMWPDLGEDSVDFDGKRVKEGQRRLFFSARWFASGFGIIFVTDFWDFLAETH